MAAGNLPAVSFLRAASYQDGHAGCSDPLDEQHFLVGRINAIERSPQWASTAAVIAYDGSGGWYDQAAAPIANGSTDTDPDNAGDTPMCAGGPAAAGGYLDRCGPGPRLPLLVVSPYSKRGHIDHTPTTQASVLRFIEDNWRTGRTGDRSFDAWAGPIEGMLDFHRPQQREVLLAASGAVASAGWGARAGREAVPVASARQLAERAPVRGAAPLSAAGAAGGAFLLAALAGGALLFTSRRRTP